MNVHPRILAAVHAALGVIEVLTGLLALVAAALSVTFCTGVMGAASSDAGDGALVGMAVGGFFGLAFSLLFVLPALAVFAMAALRAGTVWYLRGEELNKTMSTTIGIIHLIAPILLLGWLFAMSPLMGVLLLPVGIVWMMVSVWSGIELLRSASPPPSG